MKSRQLGITTKTVFLAAVLAAWLPVLAVRGQEPDTNEIVSPPPALTSPPGNVTDRVRVGGSVYVAPDEKVNDAVAVFGEARVEGEVLGDLVSVFGQADLAAGGEVHGDMAVVFGDARVDGVVHGDQVVVFGSTTFGPGAAVDGDCVAVFGSIDGDAEQLVSGDVVRLMPWFGGLSTYLREGPLKGRLIPLTSVFAWAVVGIHLVIYFLVVLLLPGPVAASIEQVRTRPLQSFGVGLLALCLVGPLTGLLVLTGIGIVLVPVIGLAETAFLVLGKTAFLEFLGLRVLRTTPDDSEQRPLTAFLIGFLLLTLVYMVPVVALLAWGILRPLSLGAPIVALFTNGRGNGNAAPPIPVSAAATPAREASLAGGDRAAEATTPAAPDVRPMKRAGFWIRLAAAFLDLLLLSWLVPFSGRYFLLIWVAYHIGLWAWRGTTIGGIVCKLKVVRMDGNPLDPGVAVVRSLSSLFSAVPLFLGFFWAGWTSSRQSWHDMIAGTVIVRVPKGVSLV